MKDYWIEMEERGEYLWVILGGERMTANISVGLLERDRGTMPKRRLPEDLDEEGVSRKCWAVDMVEMAEHLGRVLPGHKIAFFDRYGHEGINELGKKLARNRDVILQVFKSVADAEKWLIAN